MIPNETHSQYAYQQINFLSVAAEHFERRDKALKQTSTDGCGDTPAVSEQSSAILS